VLQWASRTLSALHGLSKKVSTESSAGVLQDHRLWQGSTRQITLLLSSLKPSSVDKDESVALQRMYIADLKIQSLHASWKSQGVEALWYELLADAMESAAGLGETSSRQNETVSPAVTSLRQSLVAAIEAELRSASDRAPQWLQTHWPPDRRGQEAPGASTAKHTKAISGLIADYRTAAQWKQRAQDTADPRAREHLGELCKRWLALADYRVQWAVYCEENRQEGDSSGTDNFEGAYLKSLGQSREMAVKAIDLALRSLQAGNEAAYSFCMTACADLKVLTSQSPKSNVYHGYFGKCADFKKAKIVVDIMLTCADHLLKAAEAKLNGRHVVASAWRTAAQTRETALARGSGDDDASKMLRSDWQKILQRADTQAQQARKAEETTG
jgi:hypothetical protein